MLHLNLFGTGRATFDDRSLAGFPHQRPWLVLCYLLLERRRSHSREQLAAVFWGDQPTQVARKDLRNTLWRLHELFSDVGADYRDYVSIEEERVGFRPRGQYWLDVEIFETSITRQMGVAAEQLLPTQVRELEQAMAIYQGELLDGVYDDWCLSERERLHLLYTGALHKLMIYHGHVGNFEAGLDYGRRILALDNTHETVHRHMMQLFWQAGDRTAALAQFKLCCQILRDELGAPPTAETRSLYERILHDGGAGRSTGTLQPGLPNKEFFAELQRTKHLMAEASAALAHLEAALGGTL